MATVTAEVLAQYKQMIADTSDDLKDHLQDVESKLENIPSQDPGQSDEGEAERKHIED